MKVSELMAVLAEMPQGANVWSLWDGEARGEIFHVWESQDGRVIASDDGEMCYSTTARPIGAPTQEENPYWKMSKE